MIRLKSLLKEIKGLDVMRQLGLKLGDTVKFRGQAHPSHTAPIALQGTIEYFEPADEIGIRTQGYGKFISLSDAADSIESPAAQQDITSRINTRSIEFEDIDPRDYPDFADAYISYAEFEDGTPLNDEQLEQLDADRDWVYDRLQDYLY